jgi:dolichol-phosphate mannosyltransferase
MAMLNKLLQKQAFRYLICGTVMAAFNVLLISSMIEMLKLNTPVLRNIANVSSIEISLLLSFFVYKIWVWTGGTWNIKKVLFYQIPLYHVSAGISVLARSLILFPILDWLGVQYAINTLVGILLGAVINYKISDKVVFKTK